MLRGGRADRPLERREVELTSLATEAVEEVRPFVRQRRQELELDMAADAGSVRIEPGDLVFGDVDGVVVVPRRAEDEVLSRAFQKVASENRTRDELLQGAKLGEVFDRYGVL